MTTVFPYVCECACAYMQIGELARNNAFRLRAHTITLLFLLHISLYKYLQWRFRLKSNRTLEQSVTEVKIKKKKKMVVCNGSLSHSIPFRCRAHATHLIKTCFVNFNFNKKCCCATNASPKRNVRTNATLHKAEKQQPACDSQADRGRGSAFAGYAKQQQQQHVCWC